jgi:DNA-binding NtrC family response regulator
MPKPTILIAESNSTLRHDLSQQLPFQGYELTEAFDRKSIVQAVRTQCPDLLILGSVGDNEMRALEVAREIRRYNKGILLILIVENSSEEIAIAALRAGINDYFSRPFALDDLLTSINYLLTDKSYFMPSGKTELTNRSLIACERLIGQCPSMLAIKSYLFRVAITDSIVLITGETGTGKEFVAELIHDNSSRRDQPFICVNCAALPETLTESELFGYERGAFTGAVTTQAGKFEQANAGTIFLDEIGDMSTGAQSKILRVIESRELSRLGSRRAIPLDVRIVAASNQTLEPLIEEGKFRKDLYYRLNVGRIHLPPLRERKEDIPTLLEHFVRQMNRKFNRSLEGFDGVTIERLLCYDWPGNVRELKNLCEACFINNLHAGKIAFVDLPELYQNQLQEVEVLPRSELEQLLSTLFVTNWNVSKAAKKLHWSRMTIYRKIEKYHIKIPDSRKMSSTESPRAEAL